MIDFTSASIDFYIILPEIILLAAAFIILLSGFSESMKRSAPIIAGGGLLIALYFSLIQYGQQHSGFYGMVTSDNFGVAFKIIFIFISFLSLLIAHRFLIIKKIARFEFYSLLLISTMGMMVMANTTDLVVIFLGLEIMSVPLYVMAGFARRSLESNEAGIKYFIMGAFASGFLLMGIAFIFGASGTTDLRVIVADFNFILSHAESYFTIGIALLVVGFGFKVGAVPFHSWIPDVYQGAPTPVTAFFSTGPKAAGFAALLRIFMFGFEDVTFLPMLFYALAVLTMIIGNVMALHQNNIKRLLAFSSIAHAGYILVAFAVGGAESMSAAIFYLIAYAIFNLGGFAVVTLLESRSGSKADMSELAGLAKKHPYLCAVLALFMFALAGFPPTVGFIGKFYIFSAAVKSGFIWLAVIGVMNSFISVYYYLRVIKVSYFEEEKTEFKVVEYSPAILFVLAVTAIGTLGFGFFPHYIIEFTQKALFAFL